MNESANADTITLRSPGSHSRQSRCARASGDGIHPPGDISNPTSAGISDIVSAGIHFAKGSAIGSNESHMNTKHNSYFSIRTGIDARPNDDTGMRTIPELERGAIEEISFGLSPLKTRSESAFGESTTMKEIRGATFLPITMSGAPSVADAGCQASGTPVYNSNHTTTSTTTVGVRANSGAAAVGTQYIASSS